jgi:hypothetical protein
MGKTTITESRDQLLIENEAMRLRLAEASEALN